MFSESKITENLWISACVLLDEFCLDKQNDSTLFLCAIN